MPLPSAPSGMSGGMPTQGLTSPMSEGLPTNAAGGMAPPATPAAELSRGFNAGFGASGGPAAPLMPPVQSPPPTAGGGAPSGGFASGPAPVSAASGAPGLTEPPAPVSAPSPPTSPSGAGVPAGPVGPLPPFGSDIPSAPASSGAVSSAAGGPSGSPAASGVSSSSAPVAPLPPGVVGSGVGASAGAATEGIRSSLPDPLLDSAEQIVYQLLQASRLYLFLDWCVGMFRTRSGVETIIVSSEGTGYIPQGVFVPRAARMLFSDPTLGPQFASRWFSWANPAETMVAFAELVTTNNPNVGLWALAVSTDHGGSSVPAREAGVPHFAECSVNSAGAIRDDAPAMALDSEHLHRLETLDHAEYTRLIGLGDGRRPDQSEAWRTTLTAADTTMRRAGELLDFVVPPVVREVVDLLGKGVRVPPDRWVNLQSAMLEAVGTGAALRPGRMHGDMPASAHARSYHDLARLMEMLLLWNLDETDNEIKYPELAYLARQIESSAATE
ncbi:methyl-accepting chemotaxis sensory transducer [Mycobacterium sp. JS623]|uniref:methyl-accepting chemotaxis sensory transducer n=1 Tax=Mycobacterium sp. JS623 TaxID=212767 RepID=UPI0012F9F578|nr:methyl-accepting chemotaxis sensory transducer [Mycobacterium sp. JS623]